jgi:hypothetical protein
MYTTDTGRHIQDIPGFLVAVVLADFDLFSRAVLKRVGTFNIHPHLPYFLIPPPVSGEVQVLAKQLISRSAYPC